MKQTRNNDSPIYTRPGALLVFEMQADGTAGSNAGQDCYAYRLSEDLRRYFGSVTIASTAEEIWEALFKQIPSVIVVELTMRNIDALGLIRSLRSSKFCFDIRYFVCCERVNDSVKSICKHNDIDGAFSYAEDTVSVSDVIFDKYSKMQENSTERRLSTLSQMLNNGSFLSDHKPVWEFGSRITDALLVPLGFKAEHKGVRYLEFVICMRVFGAEKDMQRLYCHTAECYGTTPAAVEKAIRYAVERAWSGSTPYMQYRMFGNTVDPERGKPTASEFVETIVRHTVERLRGIIDYNDI